MKRLWIGVIGVMTSAVLLSGCGNNGNTTGERPTIRIFTRVNAEVQFDKNNDAVKALEDAANVNLEIEAPPPSSYNDKLQITMASGDLPDITYIFQTDNNYDTWAKNGLFLTLDDKIDQYPNIKNNITDELWEIVKAPSTGQINAVPKPNIISHYGYVVNQKWLDTLNMTAPTTLDEFYEYAKAVATQDPDGNGANDTYAISPSTQNTVGTSVWGEYFLMSAFNMQQYANRPDADGQYKPKEKFEGYYPYLTFMRKLYEEKLMDPEFFINKANESTDKLLQNRIGMMSGHDGNVKGLFGKAPTEQVISDYSFYAPLKDQNTGEVIQYLPPAIWGCWAIAADSKVADAALSLIDYCNSKEGWLLTNIGVQGVHYESYTPETKELIRTEEQSEKCRKEMSSYTPFAVTYQGEPAYISLCDTPEKLEKYNQELERYLSVTTEKNVPTITSPKYITLQANNPDLFKKRDQMEIQYVTGEITLEELKSFIEGEFLPATAEADQETAEMLEAASQK
ncbi:extracellular solute-binding protein [Ructibacterium gallinarum]|uniref:Extracellular solute-binding protein n=1 Tax=Ructibacterium gallinarum TaxID=2779355 RepID=A0A9D5M2K6_9FIRM|nr:extracellular solute-binding protein [Ructibacterium gallinarum]MBE5041145.1 extracellular solute-binding protein [Ructibacterium gallinarum]